MRVIRNYIILIILVAGVLSCKYNEFDAEAAAREYCDCVKHERNNGKDVFDAVTKCDGELLAKNSFFRMIYIDDFYSNYTHLRSQKTRDSIAEFHRIFFPYVQTHCCKEGIVGCDTIGMLQHRRARTLD